MPSIPRPSGRVQIAYFTRLGLLVRSHGKTRPATFDAIEQQFSQRDLENALCRPGRWITLLSPSRVAAA